MPLATNHLEFRIAVAIKAAIVVIFTGETEEGSLRKIHHGSVMPHGVKVACNNERVLFGRAFRLRGR